MGRSTVPQVMESALRWSDGRRIFMGESPVDGHMLFRAEAEPDAIDEAVLAKWDELEAAMVKAWTAKHPETVPHPLVLHKAS